jgi:hypothetical protein
MWILAPRSGSTWTRAGTAHPVGWVGATLLLDSGRAVELGSWKQVATVPSVPDGVNSAVAAWSRDGGRIAWVPESPVGPTSVVMTYRDQRVPTELAGTKGIRTDQWIGLAWSPNGRVLHVNALFQFGSAIPVRRIGFIDVATGVLTEQMSMPDWAGIPGLHDRRPMPYDPRRSNSTFKFESRRPDEPRHGRRVWSDDGALVVWLAGNGWTETDAYVTEMATGLWKRVTIDGYVKWSPTIDPGGRRVAFFIADGVSPDGTPWRSGIRVVDLLSSATTDVPLANGGIGIASSLAFSADGKTLQYDVRGGGRDGTFVQSVPVPDGAPKGAVIRSLALSQRQRVVDWLLSADPDRVHVAIHRAADAWAAEYVSPLMKAFRTWIDRDDDLVVMCLLRLLASRRVTEAVSQLRAALPRKLVPKPAPKVPPGLIGLGGGSGEAPMSPIAKSGYTTQLLWTLLSLGGLEAGDELDRIRRTTKLASLATEAGLYLVLAGDERGWPSVKDAAARPDYQYRWAVCVGLAETRHARSVDILIPLVSDPTRRSADAGNLEGESIGMLAQHALRMLTGQSLGDDSAQWTAWWRDEAHGVLPARVPRVDDPYGDFTFP